MCWASLCSPQLFQKIPSRLQIADTLWPKALGRSPLLIALKPGWFRPALVRLRGDSLNLLSRWALAARTVHLEVQSKALRAPLRSTKLSCIWPTDCWIIGTAFNANPKETATAKSAVPRSQEGQTCWFSVSANVRGMGGLCIYWGGEELFRYGVKVLKGCLGTDGSCSVLLVRDLGEVTTLMFSLHDPKNNSFLGGLLEPGKGNNKQKCHAHSQNSVSGDYFRISHVGGGRCECGWYGFLPTLSQHTGPASNC